MKRLVLGMAVILFVVLGALTISVECREKEAEDLREKLLRQEMQREQERTPPALSWPRLDADREEKAPRNYAIREGG